MRWVLVLFVFVFALAGAQGQDAREILEQSYEKCRSVRSGQYVSIDHLKGITAEDTFISMTQCAFQKIEDDPFFPALFQSKYWYQGVLRSRALYTGDALFSMSERDSVALVRTKDQLAEHFSHLYIRSLYLPLIGHPGHSQYSNPMSVIESSHEVRKLPDEVVRGRTCHVVQVSFGGEKDTRDSLKVLHWSTTYWINKTDLVPVKYADQMSGTLMGDTVHEYYLHELKSYILDSIQDLAAFTTKSIPDYYTLKDYVHKKRPAPLPAGSIAPDWTLPLMTGGQMQLSDLRGKVVLLDFFYKACGLCILSYPEIQSLHESYGEQGLVVVGVNPIDKPGSGLEEFMQKKGVTYPIVLEAAALEEKYRISGYPTAYLIDRQGRIIYCHSGYGYNMKAKLEKMIRDEIE